MPAALLRVTARARREMVSRLRTLLPSAIGCVPARIGRRAARGKYEVKYRDIACRDEWEDSMNSRLQRPTTEKPRRTDRSKTTKKAISISLSWPCLVLVLPGLRAAQAREDHGSPASTATSTRPDADILGSVA